ncbi:MAG TPA: M6 family metalloprotease domain-containing protein [Bacteroidales bacterium]|nr:M6 family metalloprotease domain-containing protein [Bacteroidales bacterium]
MLTMGFRIAAFAVTASPYPFDFRQKDGTTLTLRMMGDEYVRWAETPDHYSLLRNATGGWEYAVQGRNGDMVPSGLLAHNNDARGLQEISLLSRTGKNLRYSRQQTGYLKSLGKQRQPGAATGFNHTGVNKMLVILIGYTDLSFTKTQTDFDNLMNQVGYNSTGSVRDLYLENSYGQFTLNTTVVGPYTAAHNMAYYGTNTPWDDYRAGELITEAVNLADPAVNYADFDNDNDGSVDGIYVIYAGYGEEAGGGADAIWAHAGYITPVTLDGKTVARYACSCELRGGSGTTISAIGVVCHEFGHSLGAPDYYDTDYETNGQYDGTGSWDLMAGGSWNNSGDTPAQHNAYTKSKVYNWITATTVSSNADITLRDIVYYPDVIQVNTTTPNEYYLCENKQLTGFNAYCPGHGMLIYHVDGNYIASNTYTINAGSHQGMYPMSAMSSTASGIMLSSGSNINTNACPWPGSGNATTFSDATVPSQKSWAGNNTGKAFVNIEENGGNIVFCVIGCDPNRPGSLTVTPASSTQLTLTWTKNPSGSPVIIAVNSVNSFGTPVTGTVYSPGNTLPGGGTVIYNGAGLNFSHAGLSPQTTYYYKAWSVLTGYVYSAGIINHGTTLCGAHYPPYTEEFYQAEIPICWSQVDYAGSGNTWQFGSVDPAYGSWAPALTGNYAYINSDAYGASGVQDADLISPVFDFTDYTSVALQFDHYFRQFSSSVGSVAYSIDNGATWTTLYQWTSTSATNPEHFAMVIPEVAGHSQVLFKWNYTGAYDYYWGFDDVSVTATYGPMWTGAVSSDWNNPGNWAGGSVPTAIQNVVIPDVANDPVVNQPAGSPAVCNDLDIHPGAILTVAANKVLVVNGNLTLTKSILALQVSPGGHVIRPGKEKE